MGFFSARTRGRCNQTTLQTCYVGHHSFLTVDESPVQTNIASVTYNGVALTLQTRTTFESDDTHIYTLVAPATGAPHDLVFNYSPNVLFGAHIDPVCLSGVHQTTPIGNVVSSYSAAATSPRSDAISMTAGSLAYDIVTCNCTPTVVGSQTQNYNVVWGGERAASSRLLDATAMAWTFSGTPRFAHSVVEIRAAGAAAPTFFQRRREGS